MRKSIESEQIGLQDPVFRPYDQFLENNITKLPSALYRGLSKSEVRNPRSELSHGKWTSQTKAKNERKTCFPEIKILRARKKHFEPTIDSPEHGRSNGILGCRVNIVQPKGCAPGCWGNVGNSAPY